MNKLIRSIIYVIAFIAVWCIFQALFVTKMIGIRMFEDYHTYEWFMQILFWLLTICIGILLFIRKK